MAPHAARADSGETATLTGVPSVVGTCAFTSTTGLLTATATPAIGVAGLGPTTLSMSGTGQCITSSGLTTVTIQISGGGFFTCAGGFSGAGGFATSMSFADGLPGPQFNIASTAVGGPGTLTVTLLGTTTIGTIDLAWNPLDDASCLTSGVSSFSLSGTFEFAGG